jgi:NAD(P)-dependent dehydrogenase (short-subunit alcohol dehydrogenase family)
VCWCQWLAPLSTFPGLVQGRARIVLDALGCDELEADEILICPTTDTSWVVAFHLAAAVVIDSAAGTNNGRRVALITGSGRGIGAATAMALAADHDIVVHYRRDETAARATADRLAAAGAATLIVKAELESADDVTGLAGRALDRFGRVDALVANAASGAFRDLLDSQRGHAQRTMETVVTSFAQLVTTLAPSMQPGGRVVAVSGTDAGFHVPAHALIGAAKAALESMIRDLAVELGPFGITANAVRPGPIQTASSAMYADGDSRTADIIRGGVPAGRFGEADEVAAVIAFLCSRSASFVSGAIIPVDGGLSASGGSWMELGRHLAGRRLVGRRPAQSRPPATSD